LAKLSAGDIFTVDALKQRDILLQRQAVMGLVWSDYLRPLSKAVGRDGRPRFGFSPIPGSVSGLAGGAFYISRFGRRPQEAMDLVMHLLDPNNQIAMMKDGLCSPLRSSYTPETLERVPYARALFDSLERGVYMFEAGRNSQIVNDAITTHVQSFLRGKIGAREALRRAANEIRQKSPANL
jgi:ABC-type glycerol-3-phosphate transport system substrate-binding protein